MNDDKSFEKELPAPPWEADSPPSDEVLKQKFQQQTGQKGHALWNELFG
jgi:hypothetical protein